MYQTARIRGPLIVLCLLALVQVALPAQASEPRISCFLFGNTHPVISPFVSYFREDPILTYSLEPIPSGLNDDQRRKYDRLYFPRTRNILLSFDMYFFVDARIQHFSPRQWHDLEYAFRDGGVSAFASFGPAWVQAWLGSVLHPVLPLDQYDFHFHKPFRVVFHDDREPVFTPFREFGIEQVMGDAYGRMLPKQAATVWADMVPLDLPWLISWRPGGSNAGNVWVMADEFNMAWWGTALGARGQNPYAIDMAVNLILYSVGRPLITDIPARRQARLLLYNYRMEKLTVLSMLEWADNFGANILPLVSRLAELDVSSVSALDSFLEQDYPTSISLMSKASTEMLVISEDAVRLKDEALFWVYIIEWLVVTSTAMISGGVVWSLMVKRVAYRAAGTTKARTISRRSLQ